jgi:hypothetical protein
MVSGMRKKPVTIIEGRRISRITTIMVHHLGRRSSGETVIVDTFFDLKEESARCKMQDPRSRTQKDWGVLGLFSATGTGSTRTLQRELSARYNFRVLILIAPLKLYAAAALHVCKADKGACSVINEDYFRDIRHTL